MNKLPTGQTGQPTVKNTAFFEVAVDEEGKWHWVLWSGNGRMVARNPAEYERRKDVVQAIRNLVKLVPSVKYVVSTTAEAAE